MKIIDTFIFYNELDLLYYRIAILYDVVDYFVIVEGNLTFSGNPKSLYYNENKERFSKFQDKIIHIIDNELTPSIDVAWKNEHHQRNYSYEGIKLLNLEPNDKIIFTDLDEIPDPNSVKRIKEENREFNILHFSQDMYWYNLTCKHKDKWNYPKILSYETLVNRFDYKLGDCRSCWTEGAIEPGGWHLTYFGDYNFIRNKIESFSHQEYNNEKYKSIENIEKHVKNCSNYTDISMEKTNEYIKIPIFENSYLPPQYEIYLKNYIV